MRSASSLFAFIRSLICLIISINLGRFCANKDLLSLFPVSNTVPSAKTNLADIITLSLLA